jgi:hypothetical protein
VLDKVLAFFNCCDFFYPSFPPREQIHGEVILLTRVK